MMSAAPTIGISGLCNEAPNKWTSKIFSEWQEFATRPEAQTQAQYGKACRHLGHRMSGRYGAHCFGTVSAVSVVTPKI